MASMEKSPPFWEKDGSLRAYANRMAVACCIEGLVIVSLTVYVILIRVKPPTVGPDGMATVISPDTQGARTPAAIQEAKTELAPTELDKENFVVSFTKNYMGYDEHTLSDHWATALSMMTANLKQDVLGKMQQDNTVGTLQDQHVRSVVTISSAKADGADPLTWHVFATRNVSRLSDRRETNQKLAEAYTIRLVEGIRSVSDPSGLMIGEFHSEQISADNNAPQR
jgi:hypothetical protein